VKNSNPTSTLAVTPAQAGVQVAYPIDLKGSQPYELDSGLRRNDGFSGLR